MYTLTYTTTTNPTTVGAQTSCTTGQVMSPLCKTACSPLTAASSLTSVGHLAKLHGVSGPAAHTMLQRQTKTTHNVLRKRPYALYDGCILYRPLTSWDPLVPHHSRPLKLDLCSTAFCMERPWLGCLRHGCGLLDLRLPLADRATLQCQNIGQFVVQACAVVDDVEASKVAYAVRCSISNAV